jgi:hypothetical protein
MAIRAWIDPISNVIRPRGVILRRDIKGFIIGPWPRHTIQAFVHELTHHWCFHSPVGLAVSLLRFRALRRLINSQHLPKDSAALLFDDMLSVDTALEVLRPLSEGLALFAEYDATPGASRIVTTPMAWASVALSQRSDLIDLSTPDSTRELAGRLADLRLQDDSLTRKMSFLSRPLTRLETVYFDGYMLVKRLYWDLVDSVPSFIDSDLFLSYIRSFFFEDYGLVNILARTYDNPIKRQVAVIERVSGRFGELYGTGLAEDVATYETACDRPMNSDHSAGIPGLRLQASDLSEGLAAMKGLLAELDEYPNMDPVLRQVVNVQRLWVSRRSLVYVAAEPALVKVANGMVSAWPDPADHEFPLITGAAAVAGALDTAVQEQGWISLVLHPLTASFATVVSIGSRVVAIRWAGTTTPDAGVAELVLDPACSPITVQQEQESIDSWVDDYFLKAPKPLSKWIAETRQSTERALGKISDAFLGRWGAQSESAIASLRHPDRFWDVFDRDYQMFKTFVALGILRDHDVLLPSLSSELLKHGWNPMLGLVRATEIARVKGVSLVRNDQGVFRWLM